MFRKVAGLCRRYLAWYGNLSYDLRTNGETFVLETVARFQPRMLFDVGANVGDWSIEAKARCPAAEVHAFEIAQPTFKVLLANTRHLPDVHCQNVGMSDVTGPIHIRHYNSHTALTTATDYPHPFEFTELTSQVITGDAYATRNGIEHIDLLKIDVEGMEERVLNGFNGMISRKAIDLVQFEYGRVSILNRFLLRDFHSFFRERGYVVGKVFPNHVDFREYDLADEDFMGPNYLACREDKVEYLQALRGAPCHLRAIPTADRSAAQESSVKPERLRWKQTFSRLRADRRRLVALMTHHGNKPPALFFHPSFLCVLLYRISNHFFRAGHRHLARCFWHLNTLLTGADISEPADLGEGLVIVSPAGTAIMAKAGRNLTVMPCAGLGSELGRREDIGAGPGMPVLGDDVLLEPHCGVLGPVRVGHRVRVPAGMVLTKDVADDTSLQGPQPRFLRRQDLP
jgi:FkbM family methyltransferase